MISSTAVNRNKRPRRVSSLDVCCDVPLLQQQQQNHHGSSVVPAEEQGATATAAQGPRKKRFLGPAISEPQNASANILNSHGRCHCSMRPETVEEEYSLSRSSSSSSSSSMMFPGSSTRERLVDDESFVGNTSVSTQQQPSQRAPIATVALDNNTKASSRSEALCFVSPVSSMNSLSSLLSSSSTFETQQTRIIPSDRRPSRLQQQHHNDDDPYPLPMREPSPLTPKVVVLQKTPLAVETPVSNNTLAPSSSPAPTTTLINHQQQSVFKHKKQRTLVVMRTIGTLVVGLLLLVAATTAPVFPWAVSSAGEHGGALAIVPPKNSVCVSGGGFSGFWYTLGRLDSIVDRTSHSYYCYSAGCLGVVAALNHFSKEQMWDMAHAIQNKWKRGEISRYQVVGTFVDDLLLLTPTSSSRKQTNMLGNNNNVNSNSTAGVPSIFHNSDTLALLKIITTVKDGWFGLKTSVRTPSSVEELRTMLIQSAWIPFAIGDDLWHHDHMDGAFSARQHPTCEHHLGLVLDWDLFANVVNVNLSRQKVEKLWNRGLAHGL